MNKSIKRWLSNGLGVCAAALIAATSPARAADGAVCLFEHVNYAGTSMCLDADNAWIGSSWNDLASSVKVRAGYEVELFEHANYGGRSLLLTADTPSLVPQGFNDAASSMRVRMSIAPVAAKSAKRGIAYDLQNAGDLQALSSGVSWWYDWGLKPNAAVQPDFRSAFGMDFIPMLWNGNFNAADVESTLRANTSIKYMLVLNEPNLTQQANLTPQQAADLWPAYESIAAHTGVKIVGPAITWGTMSGYSDPVVWLDAFYAAYRGAHGGRDPQIDYLAFHWYDYGLAGQLDRLKKYGKPFWVTEFANWHSQNDGAQIDTSAKQMAQMKEMVAVCESRADVFRYAWFTGRWNNDTHFSSLLGAAGQLTDLGRYYLSLPY